MPVEKLQRFLDENDVSYEAIEHARTVTAQETAAVAHIPGKELAKTVIVEMDGELAMVVLPATAQVSLERLRSVTGADDVSLASEDDFSDRFPGVEDGAMPPFGNLWGMEVYVDESLREDEEIAFNAGTHTELLRMAYADFERLVGPTVADVGNRA